MSSTSSGEIFKEVDISREFTPHLWDLRFCKESLEVALKDSKSLTVYLPPVNIIMGRDLLIATETASRLLEAGLKHTGIDTMEHGNMIYQVRRDNLAYDFNYTLPSDTKAGPLPYPTGYMRADIEEADSPRFTVGAIDFQAKEFTAVEF